MESTTPRHRVGHRCRSRPRRDRPSSTCSIRLYLRRHRSEIVASLKGSSALSTSTLASPSSILNGDPHLRATLSFLRHRASTLLERGHTRRWPPLLVPPRIVPRGRGPPYATTLRGSRTISPTVPHRSRHWDTAGAASRGRYGGCYYLTRIQPYMCCSGFQGS